MKILNYLVGTCLLGGFDLIRQLFSPFHSLRQVIEADESD